MNMDSTNINRLFTLAERDRQFADKIRRDHPEIAAGFYFRSARKYLFSCLPDHDYSIQTGFGSLLADCARQTSINGRLQEDSDFTKIPHLVDVASADQVGDRYGRDSLYDGPLEPFAIDNIKRLMELSRSAVIKLATELPAYAPDAASPLNDGLTYCFTVRTKNALKREGINTIGDLISNSPLDLLRLPNVGRKTFAEINDVLKSLGLSLAPVNGRPIQAVQDHQG